MKNYTLVEPIYLSFFSKSVYQSVVRNWKGYGLLYLLALLALCTIPGILRIHSEFVSFLNNEAPAIIKQFPEIKITKGKVSLKNEVPYYIRNEKTGDPLIIIDTSGQIKSLDGTKALILLTEKELMVRRGENEFRTFGLKDIDSVTVDRSTLYKWADTMEESFGFILYPFALLFSFFYHVAELSIYTLIGILLSKKLKTSLSFQALMRLSAVSMTPAIVTGTITVLLNIAIPFWFFISIIITASYLFFGIKANLIVT